VNFQSFEFSCSFASLAAHAVWQLRNLLPVSCRCRVAVELVSLVLRAIGTIRPQSPVFTAHTECSC
jgi:hypothetical protein